MLYIMKFAWGKDLSETWQQHLGWVTDIVKHKLSNIKIHGRSMLRGPCAQNQQVTASVSYHAVYKYAPLELLREGTESREPEMPVNGAST